MASVSRLTRMKRSLLDDELSSFANSATRFNMLIDQIRKFYLTT